jgi:hypothetical protein
MTIHKLKLNAAYYDDSASGIKTFAALWALLDKYDGGSAEQKGLSGAQVGGH